MPRTGYASSAFVHLQLLGSAPLRQGIDHVEVQLGSAAPARIPLRDGDHWYHLMLRPDNSAGGDSCLRLRSASFLEGSNPRRLGVPFGALRLELWTPGGIVWPPLDLWLSVGLLAALAYMLFERLTGSLLAAALPVALASVGLLVGVYLRLIAITFDTARMLVIPLATALYLSAALSIWSAFQRWLLPRYREQARPLASELLLVLLGLIALYGGRELAQQITGHHSFYPLKAGVWPNPNWLLIWPGLLYGAFLAFVLKALRHEGQLPTRWLLPLLVLFAAIMPVALKVAVRGWDSLLYTYSLNPSDYIHDVPRIGNDLRGFLGQYVELSPYLRLHNRNHPPGSVIMLWGVAKLFGPGPVPATAVTVLLAASAVLPVYWVGTSIGGQRVGLLGAAIYAVIPGHLIYTVTSMDAIFNSLLAWALWAFWIALRPDGKAWMALLAGVLLGLGLFLSFATLTLGIFGIALIGNLLLHGYHNWCEPAPVVQRANARQQMPDSRYQTPDSSMYLIHSTQHPTPNTQQPYLVGEPVALAATHPLRQAPGFLAPRRHVLQQAALIMLALVGFYGLLYLWSGFNIVASIFTGTRNNFDEVQQDLPPSGLATYMFYVLVNLIPFMWYLSFWGLPIMARASLQSLQRFGRATPLELLTGALAIQILGLAFSGLFTREVERIWGFVYPLVAVVIASFLLQRRRTLWWAAIGLTQFFLLSAYFRTWLNTYW